jgi:hypothetical protein
MNYLVTSAATSGSKYEDYLQAQRDYFEKEGAFYFGMVLDDRGNKKENTKIKTEAILKAFKINPVVLWIEPDSLIDPPKIIPGGDWDIGTLKDCNQASNFSTGFILFRDSPGTRRFLQNWEILNKKHVKSREAFSENLSASSTWLQRVDISSWLEGRQIINELENQAGRI